MTRLDTSLKGDDGWQPIETAPPDGTKFIAFMPEFDGLENSAQIECWFDTHGNLQNVYEMVPKFETYWPTHWRQSHKAPKT